MVESWSFNVLLLDQKQKQKEKISDFFSLKLDFFSFSFILLFNFHKVENVYKVECTGGQ